MEVSENLKSKHSHAGERSKRWTDGRMDFHGWISKELHIKNFVITLQRYVHEFMSNFHIRIPFRELLHTTDSL